MDKILVSECGDCGARSVPGFGMASRCRYNQGAHHNIRQVEVDIKEVREQFWAIYNCVPWFDRQRFDESNSPEYQAIKLAMGWKR